MKSSFLRPIPPNFEQTYPLTAYEIFKNLKPAHHIPANRQHKTLSWLARYISVLVQVERADSPYLHTYSDGWESSLSQSFYRWNWLSSSAHHNDCREVGQASILLLSFFLCSFNLIIAQYLAPKGAFYTWKVSKLTPENQQEMEHFELLIIINRDNCSIHAASDDRCFHINHWGWQIKSPENRR